MKITVLLFAILAAYPVFAQRHPVRVKIVPGSDEQLNRTLVSMLSGRVGAASRYALVTSADADILLSVECLENVVGGRRVGNCVPH